MDIGFKQKYVDTRQTTDDKFTTLTALIYQGSKETFQVPENFITDLASVPRAFTWLFPRYGRYTMAAILHDFLYETLVRSGLMSYRDADGILRQAMRLLGVPFATRWMIWSAVRLAGLFRIRGKGYVGWWRDAPAVLFWAVLALPFAAIPGLTVAVSLGLLKLCEFVVWVPLKLFSRRKYVNPPIGKRADLH